MKIIKRSGKEVDFDAEKIKSAITRANLEVKETERATEEEVRIMTESAVNLCKNSNIEYLKK